LISIRAEGIKGGRLQKDEDIADARIDIPISP
jgi:hypothetical protein